jgi:hypothetical protein
MAEAKSAVEASTATTVASNQQLVFELNSNDVLCGRGVPVIINQGNVRFRELIRTRKAEYTSNWRHQIKHSIAQQVFRAVQQRGGRFVRVVESLAEKQRWQIPAHIKVWQIIREEEAVEKIKQALRGKDSQPKTSSIVVESGVAPSVASLLPQSTINAHAAAAAHAIGNNVHFAALGGLPEASSAAAPRLDPQLGQPMASMAPPQPLQPNTEASLLAILGALNANVPSQPGLYNIVAAAAPPPALAVGAPLPLPLNHATLPWQALASNPSWTPAVAAVPPPPVPTVQAATAWMPLLGILPVPQPTPSVSVAAATPPTAALHALLPLLGILPPPVPPPIVPPLPTPTTLTNHAALLHSPSLLGSLLQPALPAAAPSQTIFPTLSRPSLETVMALLLPQGQQLGSTRIQSPLVQPLPPTLFPLPPQPTAAAMSGTNSSVSLSNRGGGIEATHGLDGGQGRIPPSSASDIDRLLALARTTAATTTNPARPPPDPVHPPQQYNPVSERTGTSLTNHHHHHAVHSPNASSQPSPRLTSPRPLAPLDHSPLAPPPRLLPITHGHRTTAPLMPILPQDTDDSEMGDNGMTTTSGASTAALHAILHVQHHHHVRTTTTGAATLDNTLEDTTRPTSPEVHNDAARNETLPHRRKKRARRM